MHFWHLISQYNKFAFACFVFGRSFYLLSFSFLFWTKISIYSYSLVCLFLGNCCTKFPLNEIQINILKVVFLFQSFTSPKKKKCQQLLLQVFFLYFSFFSQNLYVYQFVFTNNVTTQFYFNMMTKTIKFQTILSCFFLLKFFSFILLKRILVTKSKFINFMFCFPVFWLLFLYLSASVLHLHSQNISFLSFH